MTAAARLPFDSVHRVSAGWRWMIVLCVPPLVALMGWAIGEMLQNQLRGDARTQWWVAALGLTVCAGLTLTFLAALIWAFRARVTIAGNRMTVRGALLTTIIDADRLSSFRFFNGQLYVYLKGRRFSVTIGGFENLWLIYRWLEQRTTNLDEELRDAEDEAIKRDLELGTSQAAKEERLAALHRLVRRANWLIYAAAGIGALNFLFVEVFAVALATTAVLVLTPVWFDTLAFANRGHIKVDQDEGSRYPQIFTGTLVAGCALALMSLLDRGALLDSRFYEILGIAVLVKGFFWYSIDPARIATLKKRGALVFSISVVAIFLLPAFWVGGSLYQLNQLLDSSATTWHATEIAAKEISSGRTTSYTVAVVAWDESIDDPLEITLRRDEFNALETGQRVEVGVREGAFGIAWVAALIPRPRQPPNP